MSTVNGNPDLKARIRSAKGKSQLVTVDDWDGVEIELRSMTIAEKGSVISDDEDMKPEEAAMMLPRVVIFTCHDPNTHQRLFTEEDLEWLKDEPANVIEELALPGLAISGVDEKALEAAKVDS